LRVAEQGRRRGARELRPFGEVVFRRRKHGISGAVRDVPVGLFCFELLYADGQDLARLSYPQRRARRPRRSPSRPGSG
jgi:ATP-dependent DNA ligase